MNECPFCHKKSLIDIGFHRQKSFRCEKTEKMGGTYYSSTQHKEWYIDLYSQKYVCTDCGMVHEKVDTKSLKDYMKNIEYIVK